MDAICHKSLYLNSVQKKIKNLVWTKAKPYFDRFINEIKQYESDLNGVRNNFFLNKKRSFFNLM